MFSARRTRGDKLPTRYRSQNRPVGNPGAPERSGEAFACAHLAVGGELLPRGKPQEDITEPEGTEVLASMADSHPRAP